MPRSLLLKLVSYAKTEGPIDWALRYNPFVRGRVLEALRHSGRESQAELLRDALQVARKTRYGAGRSEIPGEWPVLSKETLHAAPMDFIHRHALPRIPAASGGTTGMPLKLWRSLECIAAEQVFLDELLADYKFSMRSRMAVLRADAVKPVQETDPPYGRISHGGNRLTLSTAHLNAATLCWYVGELKRFAPSILWVYPSAAINLYTLMERAGLTLSIPVMLASSEGLNGATHAALAQFFGCTLVNYYGQAERVCLASSTKPGMFYFHPAYGHVELIPSPEENAFKIIATGYWNHAMPLVRYDTGDLLYAPPQTDPERIARGEAPFTAIAGRDGEYLLTREGMRIIGLNHIPREVEHVAQMQLAQPDYDTLIIRVIPLPSFCESDAKRLQDQARAKLPRSMIVSVEIADRLVTTPRGKTPFVIRAIEKR